MHMHMHMHIYMHMHMPSLDLLYTRHPQPLALSTIAKDTVLTCHRALPTRVP